MKRENEENASVTQKDTKKGENKKHFNVEKTPEYIKIEKDKRELESEVERLKKSIEKIEAREKDAIELAKNYKKDMERVKLRFEEKERDLLKTVQVRIAKQLLDIEDNFERALSKIKDESIYNGIKMIDTSIDRLIDDLGVKKLEIKKGDEFDENKMEAVFAEAPQSEEEKVNTVSKVFSSGYMFTPTEEIIRYAKVSIYKED